MMTVNLRDGEMQGCVQMRTPAGAGTAFAYGSEFDSFFLTASHNLVSTVEGDNVLFSRPDGWTDLVVDRVWHHPDGDDLAAFTIRDFRWKVEKDANQRKFNLSIGEELKFIGFPHGLTGNYPTLNGFSTPFVKTASFSGVYAVGNRRWNMLDGINNPGFSGGPIYAKSTEDGVPALFGVISGYRVEERSKSLVYQKDENGDEHPVEGLYTKPNSGMIHAVGRDKIEEIIRLVDTFNGSKTV